MMLEPTRRECHARAAWYVARIDALQAYIHSHARLDSDDVQLCQSMLREILARFRADRRPPIGVVPIAMQLCLQNIAEANALLRVSAGSRPGGRWREELTVCRARFAIYLEHLSGEKTPVS